MTTKNVNMDEKLNDETIKAIKDAEKGIGLSKGYTDIDEMWKDLEKGDMIC